MKTESFDDGECGVADSYTQLCLDLIHGVGHRMEHRGSL